MLDVKQGVSASKNSTVVRSNREGAWVTNGIRAGFRILNRAAPEVASLAAEQIFRSPRRHARPVWEQEVLASAERFSVPWGAESLPAWTWGKGPTVMLVHGWEGRGSQLGAFVEPLVETGYRVVTFDSPGHGDGPGRQAALVEMARGVFAALADVGPVHGIIAHSVGCVATTHALSRARWASPRLVFVAPPTSPVRFTQAFAAHLGIDERVRLRMIERLEARYGVPLAELDALALAPAMRAPLLVVHDRDDREVPFEAGAALADRWPGARLLATRSLGHRRVLRTPVVIDNAVEMITGAAPTARTGLDRLGLERDLYERERRRAA